MSPSAKDFRGIFIGILHHQQGSLVYIPSTKNIISSYDAVFDERFSSVSAYTSQPYSEAMAMRLSVTYTPCDTSPREETGDIITFTQFEEGGLLSEKHNDAETGYKPDDDSIMSPLTMDSGDESDHDRISTEILEDIRDGSQSHPSVNRRYARYKIRDRIKQRQSEWKGALKAAQKMDKGLHKVFNTAVKHITQDLPPLGESGSEFPHFILEPRNFAETTKILDDIKNLG